MVTDFATGKAKSVILSHGMPTKVHQGDKDLDETMAKWRQSRDADEAWLKDHERSPYVKEAIQGVLSEKSFKALLHGAGRPRFDGGRETWEEYQRVLKRFEQKRVEAKQWTLSAH